MNKVKSFFLFLLMLMICNAASADPVKDAEFNDLVDRLREEGTIPRVRGNITSFGNYEDSLTNMGIAQWFTMTEAENFVLYAKVAWISGSETPNGAIGGCGVVFSADPGTKNHLMTSIRMDGYVYLSGTRGNSPISYGRYYYGNPWWEGNAEIILVVNGDTVSFYMNGQRMFTQPSTLILGNGLGLATLSGTNMNFGTCCSWEDIYLFSWMN